MINVAVDANGGDYAPKEAVLGAIDALKCSDNIKITLLGTKDALAFVPEDVLNNKERFCYVETTEVIEMAEAPTRAIRSKKDSSLVVGMNMIKNKEIDALVSAGSTGAVLAGGQFLAKTIPGVKRSPLAPLVPTSKGHSVLVDCGANVDARPEHLLQFAIMGSIYMEKVLGVNNPKVAIVNIGAEEEKGNALVHATFPLLKECKDINFVGNIEARDIPKGEADVIVCEAFVGNVILKMYEGVSQTMMGLVKEAFYSSLKTKIGAALVKDAIKDKLKSVIDSDQGGAPLLGLNGLVVKAHGNSKRDEIRKSVLQCEAFVKQDVTGRMKELFS